MTPVADIRRKAGISRGTISTGSGSSTGNWRRRCGALAAFGRAKRQDSTVVRTPKGTAFIPTSRAGRGLSGAIDRSSHTAGIVGATSPVVAGYGGVPLTTQYWAWGAEVILRLWSLLTEEDHNTDAHAQGIVRRKLLRCCYNLNLQCAIATHLQGVTSLPHPNCRALRLSGRPPVQGFLERLTLNPNRRLLGAT